MSFFKKEKQKIKTWEDYFLEGKTIKDLSNKQLLECLKNVYIESGMYLIIQNEVNHRFARMGGGGT